jgi:hypothetical protein
MEFATSVRSFSRISTGIIAGATNPHHCSTRKSSMPVSDKVARSGKDHYVYNPEKAPFIWLPVVCTYVAC